MASFLPLLINLRTVETSLTQVMVPESIIGFFYCQRDPEIHKPLPLTRISTCEFWNKLFITPLIHVWLVCHVYGSNILRTNRSSDINFLYLTPRPVVVESKWRQFFASRLELIGVSFVAYSTSILVSDSDVRPHSRSQPDNTILFFENFFVIRISCDMGISYQWRVNVSFFPVATLDRKK